MKPTYSQKLKDPRWQKKRLEILNRDQWTCRECQTTSETLHVHHCLYQKGKEPWEYDDRWLMALCDPCHEKRQSLEHDVKLEFARALSELSEEQLGRVMEQIIAARAMGLENGLVVESVDQNAINADVRWFSHACNNPEFRPAYDAVTGYRTNWEAIF